ncbi:MAG: hypothetical protein TREMPRED_004738 [Tremellales sp. Tagirdzhanova-0007]|nr:MAG: hypothetical protein TREMPRED_004738 [Tremellales sp. Tagirdzhanova-0007]
MDCALGWFADPIYLGHYPEFLVKRLGDRLPKFSKEEMALVQGSSEFYGCNTYTTNLIKAGGGDDFSGGHTMGFIWPDGSEIGEESQLGWLRDVPWGFRKLLVYVYKRYKTPIYCTENGWAIKDEYQLTPEKAIRLQIYDSGREVYYRGYLTALKEAVVEDKVDVRSYFAWSYVVIQSDLVDVQADSLPLLSSQSHVPHLTGY